MANPIAEVISLSQGNVTSESAFPSVADATKRAVLSLEPVTKGPITGPTGTTTGPLASQRLDGRAFRVKASFMATGGGALNYTAKIYWNVGSNTNLTTLTNDVLLISSGAVATASGSISITLSAICLWDSVSQQLCAYQEAGLNNIGTPAVLNAGAQTITATNPVATGVVNQGSLQFFVTGLFSSSNAGNKATLVGLSIEEF